MRHGNETTTFARDGENGGVGCDVSKPSNNSATSAGCGVPSKPIPTSRRPYARPMFTIPNFSASSPPLNHAETSTPDTIRTKFWAARSSKASIFALRSLGRQSRIEKPRHALTSLPLPTQLLVLVSDSDSDSVQGPNQLLTPIPSQLIILVSANVSLDINGRCNRSILLCKYTLSLLPYNQSLLF